MNEQLCSDATTSSIPFDTFVAEAARPPSERHQRLFRRFGRLATWRAIAAIGTVAAIIVAGTAVVTPSSAFGSPPPVADTLAYSHDQTAPEDHSDWMADLDGDKPIWQLSLPGSHDSYTGQVPLDDGDTTETLPVSEQLNMGIRAIDVRLNGCSFNPKTCSSTDQNDFYVEHGGYSLNVTLSDVLGQLKGFLSEHPGEFVILRAQVENEGNDFTTNMNAVLDKYSDTLWNNPDPAAFQNPPLSAVRGKIVLLKQFPTTPATINSYGIVYGAPGFQIEDHFKWSTDWDLYAKWTKIVANWTAAVQYAKTGDTSKGYITYISASGGQPAPWFYSSGFVMATLDDALPTGLTNKVHGASDYPDFKWVSCVPDLGGDLCSVAFTGTNILMYDVLSGQNRAGAHHADLRGQQGMGLIFMNFPGQPLVDSIMAAIPATSTDQPRRLSPTPAERRPSWCRTTPSQSRFMRPAAPVVTCAIQVANSTTRGWAGSVPR